MAQHPAHRPLPPSDDSATADAISPDATADSEARRRAALDDVDAQSAQSFPASDPPSWSGTSISGGPDDEPEPGGDPG